MQDTALLKNWWQEFLPGEESFAHSSFLPSLPHPFQSIPIIQSRKIPRLLLGCSCFLRDPGPVSYFLTTALQRATWPSCGQFDN